MDSYKISTARLRYIVPFEIDLKKESFETVCERVDKYIDYPFSFLDKKNEKVKGKWIRESLRIRNQDVYSYIIEEFSLPGEINYSEKIEKIGVYYHYDSFSNNPLITHYKDKDIECDLKLNDMGMYIFRSGVGLLWYELGYEKDAFPDSLALIRFQSKIKQLDRSHGGHLTIDNRLFEVEKEIPFLLGSWLVDRISFLDIDLQTGRKNYYIDILKDYYDEELLIKYLPPLVPDKALLFTYAVFNRSEDWKKDENSLKTIYYLTSGYGESHEMSDDIKNIVGNPFSNIYWLASKEGCAYLAWQREDNSDFFVNRQYYKIMDDYFLLFIRAIYQSYSLMKYSVYTSQILSNDYTNYLTVSDQTELLNKEISSIGAEINLFLIKSVATSVSHIQHQNEFYNYLIKRLQVKEDVESVTAGLNVINDMQNDTVQEKHRQLQEMERKIQEEAERRDKQADMRFQIGLGLVTFLAAISAFADGYGLVESIATNELKGTAIIAYVLICVFTVIILTISSLLFIGTIKEFRKNKSKE